MMASGAANAYPDMTMGATAADLQNENCSQ